MALNSGARKCVQFSLPRFQQNWHVCHRAVEIARSSPVSFRSLMDAASTRQPPAGHDPGVHRRGMRQARQVDRSPTPTTVVRLSRLAPGTTATDIRCVVAGDAYAKKIKSLSFEYDASLRPLQSCRVVFFHEEDAANFATRSNRMVFAGSAIRADFVVQETVSNPTTEAYLGGMLGRLVFLYGYPPHVSPHQVRDYYRDYEIVDATLPGIQRAPQQGETFLVRRKAFIVQFSTPSEAQRFVRDVCNTKYLQSSECTIKAVLM
ncbi:hypothetical protein GGI20_001732 [Coemansia sp. BCRC 34301]|nr:hypothetical protein GGI20_001732 [Coemansia sp. BCRC 34301]